MQHVRTLARHRVITAAISRRERVGENRAVRHQSFLQYARMRYFKLALLISLLSAVAYVVYRPAQGAYGGSWVGYTLGTIGALLIVMLLWFGVRKRRYRSSAGQVQGWLSAHVYLGISLIVIVTLHAGFEVGWNVHTLAYVLMMLVIASGMIGAVAYLRYPRMITDNLRDDTLDSLLLGIGDLDRQARAAALGLPDDINATVLRAAQHTRVGGSAWRQLAGDDPRCATARAVTLVERASSKLPPAQQAASQSVYALLLRKSELLRRARRDISLRAWQQLWLYLHVPLSLALLAALIAHVVAVFAYW